MADLHYGPSAGALSSTGSGTPPALAEECRAASDAAREAGGIIARLYGGEYQVAEKSRGDPVTTADLAANRVIRETLEKRFPDDAWLSEEDVDNPERLDKRRVWIVDPLDGTREFIRGIPEFCVSIGLAVDGVAVLGVVYHPLHGELFTAVAGGGAWLNTGGAPAPVRVTRDGDGRRPSLLISRSEPRRRLSELAREFELTPMGSIAWRLASVARGRADATVTFRRVKEWDVCAGIVLVEEAGGRIATGQGERPVFNRPEPVLQRLVAGSESSNHRIQALLARLQGKA